MGEIDNESLEPLARREHSEAASAKRTQIRVLDPSDGNYYSVGGSTPGSSVALNVAILDGSGSQITSFGGGTQYTEGDTDATITGTAVMWEDAGNTLRPVSASSPLPVEATIDPTGLATSANQTTIIGHVDGIEGLLTTIDADTGNIATSTSTTATNTGNAATSLAIIDDWDNGASDGASVSGDVAHDSVDAGEPVKVGGKALDLGATPGAVASNDRTNATFLRNGVQLVLGGDPNIISKNLQVTDADGAQTDAAIVTVSAGTAIVVTEVSVSADAANTDTSVSCRIGFGTANTPAADANGVVLFHPGIPPGGGMVRGNGSGIIGIGASNEDLRVTCDDPTGGSISICVSYFTIAIG